MDDAQSGARDAARRQVGGHAVDRHDVQARRAQRTVTQPLQRPQRRAVLGEDTEVGGDLRIKVVQPGDHHGVFAGQGCRRGHREQGRIGADDDPVAGADEPAQRGGKRGVQADLVESPRGDAGSPEVARRQAGHGDAVNDLARRQVGAAVVTLAPAKDVHGDAPGGEAEGQACAHAAGRGLVRVEIAVQQEERHQRISDALVWRSCRACARSDRRRSRHPQ